MTRTIVVILLTLVALPGCAGGPQAEGDATVPVQHAEPPPPGPAHAPDGTGHVTFAIDTLLLGDRDQDGRHDEGAWRRYGFDLDHLVSGRGAPDGLAGLCIPQHGGWSPSDGEEGIDNAMGQGAFPLARELDPAFTDEVHAGLAGGGTTLLVDLDGLGEGADYTGLTARLYTGAPLGKAPAYDGTDVWPIRADSLNDPYSADTPRLLSDSSYVVGNTWVGRFHGVLPLELPWLRTMTMRLYIRDPVLTMDLDAARRGAQNGTLAGVIATSDLVAEIQDEALRFDPSLCPSTPALQAVLAVLAGLSDMLADGTQDPARPCDALSIGLGFTAKRVTLGPIVAAPAVVPLPTCATDEHGSSAVGG